MEVGHAYYLNLNFTVLRTAKAVVRAFLCHQLIVISAFDDLSVLDKHDLVAMLDGGKSVGDDKGGASLEKRLNTDLQQSLGLGVDGGGSLVKNQDGGIGKHSSRKGNQLLLTL